jgi:hypothetical protein
MARNLGKVMLVSSFIAIFCANTARGGPMISSVSGSFSIGSAISIGGSGFGTKSKAAPVKWDNFDSGTVGSNVGNGWQITGSPNYPKYSTDYLRTNSTKSVLCDFATGSNPYNSSFGLTITSDVFYVTYWRYDHPTSGTAYNYKPFRIYGTSGNSLPQAILNEYDYQNPIFYVADTSGKSILDYRGSNMPNNQWHREEYYLYAGTQGSSNGVFQHWDNGSAWGSVTGRFLIDSARFSIIRIGHFWDTNDGLLKAYIDDAYIDTTLARVEVCSGSSWNSRSHCEIQPPTSWSSSSVQVTFNRGSFSSGNTVYLYVVDSSGNVNSSGYPITIGGGSGGGGTSPSAPSAPQDLRVQ